MVDIPHVPEDLRHLRDFPTYDTTFQDSPKFRQSLQYWSLKTEKVGGGIRTSTFALLLIILFSLGVSVVIRSQCFL